MIPGLGRRPKGTWAGSLFPKVGRRRGRGRTLKRMPRKARQMQHGDGESSRSYSLVPDVGGGSAWQQQSAGGAGSSAPGLSREDVGHGWESGGDGQGGGTLALRWAPCTGLPGPRCPAPPQLWARTVPWKPATCLLSRPQHSLGANAGALR